MAKNRRAKRRYEPRVTATHYIRIARVKMRIDPALRWYAIRTSIRKERQLEADLRARGIAACRGIEVDLARVNGSVRETEHRPAAGYVFAGFAKAVDGRSELWAIHDQQMAKQPPARLPNDLGELVEVSARAPSERPFTDVLGPFDAAGLAAFVCRLKGLPHAVLWDQREPVFVFPVRIAGVVDCETIHLAEPRAA
jgi:hypothetical protein